MRNLVRARTHGVKKVPESYKFESNLPQNPLFLLKFVGSGHFFDSMCTNPGVNLAWHINVSTFLSCSASQGRIVSEKKSDRRYLSGKFKVSLFMFLKTTQKLMLLNS